MTSIRPTKDITPVPENHLRAVLEAYKIQAAVAVVGIRGYVKQFAEAKSGGNLIGKYDDVLCVVTPAACRTFLGNTDPSRTITERAILEANQVVWYTPGCHNRTKPPAARRPAFVQSSGVAIRRFDAQGVLGPVLDNQWIGCNIHDGAWTTTGSAACQTVVPERWMAFVEAVLTPLGIPFSEWATVTARVKRGQAIPEHWTTAKFPYILTI